METWFNSKPYWVRGTLFVLTLLTTSLATAAILTVIVGKITDGS